MTNGAATGGLIPARSPSGAAVSINEKLAPSYIERGFTITDEAAAKRVAATMRAGARPGVLPELAPGQVRAKAPDGRVVSINGKLRAEYEVRGFTFEGSVERQAAPLRDPEPARTVIDTNNRTTIVPGEVSMTTPEGRTVNVSAKQALMYLDRGYTLNDPPEQPAILLDDVLPDAMQPGQGPASAGGQRAGTSY